ncbi:MAG TPA: UDP-N-acetylglucosamine--N-acetylmuramyl-(pentapeptide) pyrophosphoryl-undecaprenol N-acetylglucosamine transferase, partial [Chitinivibrionales bacterium]
RSNPGGFRQDQYPHGFDMKAKTILICGGSQGAQTMNTCCIAAVRHWVKQGFQVVWQTGTAGFNDVHAKVGQLTSVFVFPTLDDLYPFYACASIVVGRAGASTLAEIACFGLPCVLIPLPWATENHQWINAGVVEQQGWAVRVKQNESAEKAVDTAVAAILADKEKMETMRRKALDHAPTAAAATIVETVLSEINP